MATGQCGAQGRQAPVDDHPDGDQPPAQFRAAMEADGEAGQHQCRYEPWDELRPARPGRDLGQQPCFRLGVVRAILEMPGEAFEVPGTDHHEHPAVFAPRVFHPQAVGHVAVAFGDQGLEQFGRVLGEFGERGFQDVAFLELFDCLLVDLLGREGTQEQAGRHVEPLVPWHAAVGAAQRDRQVAIDQLQGRIALAGRLDGGLQFRPRLDAELLGDAALVAAQRQVGHDQAGLAVADDPVQVQVLPGFPAFQRLQPRRAQLHGDGIELVLFGHVHDGVDAGSRNMGGAQQGVSHAVAHQLPNGLGEARVIPDDRGCVVQWSSCPGPSRGRRKG